MYISTTRSGREEWNDNRLGYFECKSCKACKEGARVVARMTVVDGRLRRNPSVGDQPDCRPRSKEAMFIAEVEKGMQVNVRNGQASASRSRATYPCRSCSAVYARPVLAGYFGGIVGRFQRDTLAGNWRGSTKAG